MGSRYQDSTPMENLIDAVTRIADVLDDLKQQYGDTREDMRASITNHGYFGVLENTHNDRASTGTPGNSDAALAQIIFGCYCQTCSYWRGRIK